MFGSNRKQFWPRPFGTETKSKDLLGAISIELNDPDLRPFSSSVFVGALQDKVREHPLVETISFVDGVLDPEETRWMCSFTGQALKR